MYGYSPPLGTGYMAHYSCTQYLPVTRLLISSHNDIAMVTMMLLLFLTMSCPCMPCFVSGSLKIASVCSGFPFFKLSRNWRDTERAVILCTCALLEYTLLFLYQECCLPVNILLLACSPSTLLPPSPLSPRTSTHSDISSYLIFSPAWLSWGVLSYKASVSGTYWQVVSLKEELEYHPYLHHQLHHQMCQYDLHCL